MRHMIALSQTKVLGRLFNDQAAATVSGKFLPVELFGEE